MKKVIAILIIVFLTTAVQALTIDENKTTSESSTPLQISSNTELQTNEGREIPYQIGELYETQNARPIIIYQGTRDGYARDQIWQIDGQVQKEKEKNNTREQIWRKEIRANREALRTARKERIEIKSDLFNLSNKVKKIDSRVNSLEDWRTDVDRKMSWHDQRITSNHRWAMGLVIFTLVGLIIIFILFFLKGGKYQNDGGTQERHPSVAQGGHQNTTQGGHTGTSQNDQTVGQT
jgi:hypothetical protein